MIYNFLFPPEAIPSIIISCYGGYYRNLSGIIGFFKYSIKAYIHSKRQIIFSDSKSDISHQLIITLGQNNYYHIQIATLKKMLVQQGLYNGILWNSDVKLAN